MTAIRRLLWASLVLGFGHIVFGAIVRITGSGMGCGDHWPKCHGYWIPPFDRADLIIEVSHRYFAAFLSFTIAALAVVAFLRRRTTGVGGVGGALRPIILSAVLVVTAALFGAATVKFELANKGVIVTHLAIAMALLATLLVALGRAGALPSLGSGNPGSSARAMRGAYAAVALTFLALVLGALTAHVPGANSSCPGLPLCSGSLVPIDATQHLQYTHRVVAYVLYLHLIATVITALRRGDWARGRAALVAVLVATAQIAVAFVMVTLELPAVWRSLHEAVGTLLWIFVVTYALRIHRGATVPARVGAKAPVGSPELAT
jgi:heme A synthase